MAGAVVDLLMAPVGLLLIATILAEVGIWRSFIEVLLAIASGMLWAFAIGMCFASLIKFLPKDGVEYDPKFGAGLLVLAAMCAFMAWEARQKVDLVSANVGSWRIVLWWGGICAVIAIAAMP